MSKAFWEGFWFGLNPLNSLKVLRDLWRAIREQTAGQDGVKANKEQK